MIKTQFMALWDGLLTDEHTRILIVGATNRPADLDQAILRRLPYKVASPLLCLTRTPVMVVVDWNYSVCSSSSLLVGGCDASGLPGPVFILPHPDNISDVSSSKGDQEDST